MAVTDEQLDGIIPGAEASQRLLVTIALLLAMAVAALEQTVVSPAMPTIIDQLRGFRIYPWVFSAYLLASTVTTPLYGKLADRIGRKKVLLFGLGLFLLGSMLSGLARSMPGLIGMRVLQGLGAGATIPIVLTMLGDMYTIEQRARVQGWFGAVWGVSSLAGPTLGGVLTQYLSWRWVFFVTLPFGAVSAFILARYVKETVAEREPAPVDAIGAVLLTLASSAILLAILDGSGRPWWFAAGLLAGAAALTALLIAQERRAADPILPLDLFTQPAIAAAILGGVVVGGLMLGIDTFIPLYVQGVKGGTPMQAGQMVTPLFLSWAISVTVAARLVVRHGFRTMGTAGAASITLGTLLLIVGASLPAYSGPIFVVGLAIIGFGMGPTSLSYLLYVQNAVKWDRRGVATGAVAFFRTMGGALGVGILGATLGLTLSHRLAAHPGIDPAAVLHPKPDDAAPAEGGDLAIARAALGASIRELFALMAVLAASGVACSLRLPPGRPADKPAEVDPAAEPILAGAFE